MRIRTIVPHENEIIFAVKALKRGEPIGPDGFCMEVFLTTLVASMVSPSERKKNTRLECDTRLECGGVNSIFLLSERP